MGDELIVHREEHVDGRLVVALGSSVVEALRTGFNAWPGDELLPGAGPIDLLAPAAAGGRLVSIATSVLATELRRRAPGSEIRSRTGTNPTAPNSPRWLDVPAPGGADRFATIYVPSWWTETGRLCLVSRLPGRVADLRARPLMVLAALALRRQRWAAHLSRDRAALSAELAAPWRPRLLVLVGTHLSRRVAVLAHNVVAAELSWLAFEQLRPDAALSIGPWEDPAVQRATVLDLGISLPEQLQLTVLPAEQSDLLEQRLATTLGIER